jgi:CDP-4-dehydro-6-deoxyglucose reductase
MSDFWFEHARTNDLLRLHGPLGTFFLRKTAHLDLIFLATGTGIAPIRSMLGGLRGLPAESGPRSVTVFWGGRSPSDLYLDVDKWALADGYTPVCSRPPEDWRGARGYVQDALLAAKLDLSDAAVYACGSPAMIRDAQQALAKAGLACNRFYSDAFVRSGTN